MRYMYEGAKSNKIFAVGILAFLLGHFLYIAFLISNSNGGLIIGIVLTAVISVLAIPPLMKRITPPSKGLKIFGYVYLVVVIAMFSFATSMLISLSANPLTIIFICDIIYGFCEIVMNIKSFRQQHHNNLHLLIRH